MVEQDNNHSCKSFLPCGSSSFFQQEADDPFPYSGDEILRLVSDFDCDDYDDNYEKEPFKYNKNLFELLVDTDSDDDFSNTTSYSEYSECNNELNEEEDDISNDQFEKKNKTKISSLIQQEIENSNSLERLFSSK
ncbi:10542_t:CDS:2, partial [Funneliformis caledonium]